MGRLSCWKVLGIEPTKDKAAIKSAFAKLAHQVSPEDQPEEYQRIHDAYKQAMMQAKSGRVQKAKEPTIEGSPDDVNEPEEKKEDPYDFSMVISEPESHYNKKTEVLLDCIVNFKERNGITTFADVANRNRQGLTMLAIDLFGMYADLAELMKDAGVWDSYFEEPAVKSVAYEQGFRKFLADQISQGNIPYPEKIDEYCKKFTSEVLKAQEEVQKREAVEKKKEIKDVVVVIGIVVGLLIIMMISLMQFSRG